MRTVIWFGGVLCAACLLAQAPQPPAAARSEPEDKCSVEGNVYSLKTGKPLKNSGVRLQRVDGMGYDALITATDAEGHFQIGNLEAGRYTLTASCRRHLTIAYGSNGARAPGAELILTAGTRMKDLVVRLPMPGVITGRVFDEDGDPMPEMSVQLLQRGYMEGRQFLLPRGSGSTNDKGEYRAYGIEPGRYYLAAVSARATWSTPEIRSDKSDLFSYAITYYPDVLPMSNAVPIEIRPDAEIEGIDFHLVRTRTFRISGRIVGSMGSQVTYLQLMPSDAAAGRQFLGTISSQSDEKGTFLFRGIQPGRYVLAANGWNESGNQFTQTQVTVTDSDVEGLQLAFGANPEVRGSFRVEGASGWGKDRFSIGLQQEGGMLATPSAEVKEDGTFRLMDVPPERMRVQIGTMPDGTYLKSLQVDGRKLDDTVVDFSAGIPGELRVTLSPRAATISGKVKHGPEQPATDAVVVLVPGDHGRLALYLHALPDRQGTYTIGNVPPGSYRLLAFDSANNSAYQDPAWLQSFEARGEPITVEEGDRLSRDLALIVTEKVR
jgi:hypothetical protein